MGKFKPRHNPNKPQNTMGGDYDCKYYDLHSDGHEFCHDHWNTWWKTDENNKLICKGNHHNCLKQRYKYLASLSEIKRLRFLNKN
jgi:hypothetical protein